MKQMLLERIFAPLELECWAPPVAEQINGALRERLQMKVSTELRRSFSNSGVDLEDDLGIDPDDIAEKICSIVTKDWQLIPVENIYDLEFSPF